MSKIWRQALDFGARALSLFASILILSSYTSCTIAPRQPVSTIPIPETWQEGQGGEEGQELPETVGALDAIDLARWWKTYRDPLLHSLIERGIVNNLDMREATARIREARAVQTVAAAPQLPFLDWSSTYTRTRNSSATVSSASDDVLTRETHTTAGSSSTGLGLFGFGKDRNFYQSGLDASWELDFFGRIHWIVQAAGADVAAAEEDRRNILVTLLADIARNYVNLRGFQQRLAIARQNIQAQQESVEVTQARYQAGLTSALDMSQAQALLASTHSQVPSLQTEVKAGIHRLGVLLGSPPQALAGELSQERPIPMADLDGSLGLPSGLLRRRPDIRKAERELEATTARIGVAQADLFPRFSLTGRLGTQGLHFSDLWKEAALSWSTGPSVSWPIFDSGRIRANIKIQNARQEQALTRYERVILTSLEEVENALIAYAKETVRHRWLTDAVNANRTALEIANERYLNGLENYLNVVIAQRTLFTAQDELAQSQTALASQLIVLYKALGGGWKTSR